jgi:hypothetical protein
MATKPKSYAELLQEHLKKHEAIIARGTPPGTIPEAPPLPEAISNRYTAEEKDAAYLALSEAAAKEKPDENLQDVSNEQREELFNHMVSRLETRADGTRSFGQRGNSGWEVVDSELERREPDPRVIDMDNSQELMDPLGTLPDKEFLALCRRDDPLVFVLQMDPQMKPRFWIPDSLEQKLRQLYLQGTIPHSLDSWSTEILTGYVTRYADLTRQTGNRAQLSFFVRRDLYLLMLLESKGQNDQYTLVAHFYAWSMNRLEQLLEKIN